MIYPASLDMFARATLSIPEETTTDVFTLLGTVDYTPNLPSN